MAIPRLDLTVRNLQRYRQILNTFLRYGFAHLIERMDLGRVVGRRFRRQAMEPVEDLGFAVRVRLVFEELGPTFVKVGQMISTQAVGLPADLLHELSRLQDEAGRVDPALIRETIEAGLEGPIDTYFAEFSDEPLASASIAQVHRATLRDGQEVVVKVRRPGIVRLVRTDMDILGELAALAVRHVPEIRRYDPEGLVDQVARTMLREVDFRNEASNMQIFSRNMRPQAGIHVPRVHGAFTREDILVVEFIDGMKISDIDGIEAAGLDRKQIAENGASAVLGQIFRDGFFHADPHPGNLFVTLAGDIVPIDYGMMGRLDPQLLEDLSGLLIGLVRRDNEKIIRFLQKTGAIPEDDEPTRLRGDLVELLDRWHGLPLGEVDVASLSNDLFGVFNRHNVRVQAELVLLMKTLVMQDAVGRALDPDLDILEQAQPYLLDIMRRRFGMERLSSLGLESLGAYVDLARVLPREVTGLTRRLRKGTQALVMKHEGMEDFRADLERSSNRLTLGLIVAALVLGSSILLVAGPGPTVWGLPAVGLLGCAVSVIASLWLVFGIFRSGRL